MLDIEQIKAKITSLVTEANRKLKQYTPESFSKEKKFINAIVCSLALITMADKKAETQEVLASIDLIKEIDEITELEMTQEALELYEYHIEVLSKAIESPTKWVMIEAKMLMEIAKIKVYNEYPPMIEALLTYVAQSDSDLDPLETEMKDKIMKAIT
jgi:tellurite resistance protein